MSAVVWTEQLDPDICILQYDLSSNRQSQEN